MTSLKTSAPGRICLFGEHQDYLNLPVIPSAISLRVNITGTRRNDMQINLKLPDIGEVETFKIEDRVSYIKERDYFRSSVNVLLKQDYTFSNGFDCIVEGNIPINSGTSSSSALIVAWINFLTQMSDQAVQLPPDLIARYAYEAEVAEFNEPGGMMDQYSTAIGDLIFLDFFPEQKYNLIHAPLKTFILGDSEEPKDTKFILSRVKDQVIEISRGLSKKYPGFSLRTTEIDDLSRFSKDLNNDQVGLLKATLQNFKITKKAKAVLETAPLDHHEIGKLLTDHHQILRDELKISTPKIDRMIKAALDAGAYGAKINGSGGGGCMFAYAPDNPEKVKQAVEQAGGKGYVVKVDTGTNSEKLAVSK